MLEHIGHLFKAIHLANKKEIQEIKELELTEEDKKQAEVIGNLAIAALASYGIILPVLAQSVLKKAIGYGLRNLKDGVKTPDKLLVKRIINEIRELHKH